MPNGTRWVGLDVHASRTAVAVLDGASGEVIKRTVHGRPAAVMEVLEALEAPIRAVYEAGPTGYGLARRSRPGLEVSVCAPGMIPTAGAGSRSRVKTDARDALKLARLHHAGQLTLVTVPTVEQEQVRDLVRAREDVRADLMRARHRLGKLLLRRELFYPGRDRPWSARHRDWLASLCFEDVATEATFEDYLHAHDALVSRRDRLDEHIETLARSCSFAAEVARLRCLRGIDTLSAMGLCAETRGLGRFGRPIQVSAFVGLVPSEDTSGEHRRQGAITKAGSVHARRLLVEAAWHYRKPPRLSGELRRRQHDADPAAVDCAWRAQRRLHQRWRELHTVRGKRSTVTAIAVARELAHFCWEITRT
jgi:transposase